MSMCWELADLATIHIVGPHIVTMDALTQSVIMKLSEGEVISELESFLKRFRLT